MTPSLGDRVYTGFKRNKTRFVTSAFATYGVLWTIVESTSLLFGDAMPARGGFLFVSMLLVGLVVGLYRAIPVTEVAFRIAALDAGVQIAFGDIFRSQGIRVIPVNEFFDSALGDHVSPTSLHGQLIQRLFSGQAESFDALVDRGLAGVRAEEADRASGRQRRFAIGTAPLIEVDGQRYFLLALSRTNLDTLKASADLPTLWKALEGLWEAVRTRAGGVPVTLPLVGSGLAGVGLPPAQLLQLILMSFAQAQRQASIASRVRIVVAPDRFSEVDLNAIAKSWS